MRRPSPPDRTEIDELYARYGGAPMGRGGEVLSRCHSPGRP